LSPFPNIDPAKTTPNLGCKTQAKKCYIDFLPSVGRKTSAIVLPPNTMCPLNYPANLETTSEYVTMTTKLN